MPVRSSWLAVQQPRRRFILASLGLIACASHLATAGAQPGAAPQARTRATPSADSITYITEVGAAAMDEPVVLHRSEDGGRSWDSQPLDIPDAVADLVADPQRPGTLLLVAWAASRTARWCRVYRSVDAGRTWQLMADRLPAVQAAAIDPLDGDTWYLAVVREDVREASEPISRTLHGVLRTATAGRAWTESYFPPPQVSTAVRRLVPDPTTHGRLYVSFYASFSRGAPGPAAVSERIAVSEDAGETWRWTDRLWDGRGRFDGATSLVAHPTEPGLVYAGTNVESGLALSRDGGMTWDVQQTVGLPERGVVNDLVIRPDRPETLYAAVAWLGSGGVFVSTDSGRTWDSALRGLPPTRAPEDRQHPDLPTRSVLRLVLDTRNPDQLIAIVADRPSLPTPIDVSREVYHSHDGGVSWERGPVQYGPDDQRGIRAIPLVAIGPR